MEHGEQIKSWARDIVVLASASATRARLFAGAGVPFRTLAPAIDEEAIKRRLRAVSAAPAEIARRLAEAKARAVAAHEPGRIVIGADQVLEIAGAALDKPMTAEEAAAQLRRLSGRTHRQISSVCAVRDSKTIWSHQSAATLHVRALSEPFIAGYVDSIGTGALGSPGAYHLEGIGAQLFDRVEGDYFTVLGLPLLPLLAFLRDEGILPS